MSISGRHQEHLPTHASGPSRRVFLTGSAAAVGAVGGSLTVPASAAFGGGPLDQGEDWPEGPGAANTLQAPDAELRAILAEVDQANVRAIVEKLVSFGTRHTLSTQDDPVRGIGAATNWISAVSRSRPPRRPDDGGAAVVHPAASFAAGAEPDPDHQCLATLRGCPPDRVYVVTGHIDSRVTNVMNSTCDAPGADDDASAWPR